MDLFVKNIQQARKRRPDINSSCHTVIFMAVQKKNEPRCEKTGLRGLPTRSDTNRAVQPLKMARGLKFRI